MKFAEVQVGAPYPEKKFKVTEEAVKAYLAAVEDHEPLYVEERLVPRLMPPSTPGGKR